MPNREFIHTASDVFSTLGYALDSGLQVRVDEPQPEPHARMLSRSDIPECRRGVYSLLRPEWVYGPFQTLAISSGHNVGKYAISPQVNHSAITVYFKGEELDQRRRRLGSCTVSYDQEWLEVPAQILRPTVPDVKDWFKRIVSHLSSGAVIRAGVHYYYVSRSVLADPSSAHCLPPFDFIPWGIDVLNKVRVHESPQSDRSHSSSCDIDREGTKGDARNKGEQKRGNNAGAPD